MAFLSRAGACIISRQRPASLTPNFDDKSPFADLVGCSGHFGGVLLKPPEMWKVFRPRACEDLRWKLTSDVGMVSDGLWDKYILSSDVGSRIGQVPCERVE